MVGVRCGVLVLPEHDGPKTARIWRRVEELGVDHGWTYDHLSWRTGAGESWFDAMTTLAAAACVTERITLGPLVASPNFRHPVSTATQSMTIDHLSSGRFFLGLGGGATGADTTALGGEPFSARDQASRFGEFVRLLDLLLRNSRTEFAGRFFTAREVRMVPGCVQRPRVPFAIAGNGPRGMRLAAEFGAMWVTIGSSDEPGSQPEDAAFKTLRAQLDRLAATCHRTGRDFGPMRKLVNLSRIVPDPYLSTGRLVDLAGRCAELGFTDVVVAYPRRSGVFAGDVAAFERAMAALAAHYQNNGAPPK